MGVQSQSLGGQRVSFQLRKGRVIFLALIASIAILYTYTNPNEVSYPAWLPTASSATQFGSCSPSIPRTIWQVWGLFSNDDAPPPEDIEVKARTWPDRNPHYKYIRLNAKTSAEYAKANFAHRPDILRVYNAANGSVLQSDLIRYLVLLGDGGVYSDMDSDCHRSIDLWARDYENKNIGLIIGVEYDQMHHKTLLPGYSHPIQFVQWTIASRPQHPVLSYATDMIVKGLEKRLDERGNLTVTGQGEVLDITGPRIFSEGIRMGLSKHLGEEIGYSEFSMLKKPKVFGDVLVLNINGFATGVPGGISGVGPANNPQQLIGHAFHGKWRDGLS